MAVDDYDDAGAFGAGGHQVVVQGGQQHVIAMLQPRHHALADDFAATGISVLRPPLGTGDRKEPPARASRDHTVLGRP